MVVKRLPVFSVVKGGHAHYLLLFVDDRQRQDVLDGPAAVVKRLRLPQGHAKTKVKGSFPPQAPSAVTRVSHLKLKRLIVCGVHDVADLRVEKQGEPRPLEQYLVPTAGELVLKSLTKPLSAT